jgi:hypothetical protein
MDELEILLDNLLSQSFYWKRFFVAFNSWCFRMTTLTEDDLKNKVPVNKLGIYSLYCDKSQWSRRVGGVEEVKNFWNSINEGHIEMTYEFFGEG